MREFLGVLFLLGMVLLFVDKMFAEFYGFTNVADYRNAKELGITGPEEYKGNL